MISELSPQLSQANFLLPLGLLLQNGSAAELESSSSSEDEDEVEPKTMTEKMVMRELRVTVNKLKCSTDRITDHDSGSSACNDIKEDVVPFSSAYSDIQIVYNSGDKTGRSSIEPEVVNLSSASSRSISSQASHWTAPEIKETDMELDRLPKLGQAKYKVTWWVATAEPIGQSLRDSDIFCDLDTKRLSRGVSSCHILVDRKNKQKNSK